MKTNKSNPPTNSLFGLSFSHATVAYNCRIRNAKELKALSKTLDFFVVLISLASL
jgi:hypothetical protein